MKREQIQWNCVFACEKRKEKNYILLTKDKATFIIVTI